MSTIQNKTFSNEVIVVDGNRYEVCSFTNCRLVYQGGELPSFVRCEFEVVNIQLEDSAFNTLKYLTGLYSGGLSEAVEDTLTVVERGKPEEPVGVSQYTALATGTNYAQMALWSIVVIGIGIALIAALVYGYMTYPTNEVLEENEPLKAEIPLDVMPALPDELGDSYDATRADQLEALNSYSWVNEENGIISMPIDDAIDLVLEQGPPTWSPEEGE
ncbi:MAG: hypothetical protein GYB66_03520 [Chloroflexi bacterium]|nr:hypothetical protein [Chloroflexota bacterium]